ncbi:bifunctional adenosylcobinamide kinase/adenosylcobinamide-phosphate guanylyltransferase [Novosphingobium sp. PC22D]|uniref:bifunctional adenosylcobinamide kinase/adenosylcobinamide-phosphate guanylyltransferase n=1 Tax=Novosphingobium sp. PC22D TaxID=1962403 RepID=UPI000BF1D2EB|nr:bifunctional adenosylcobinamide kinase/adenosylcobinamide-phosphate guanylyltransferase [Novosphingobium sp. PC22D]PEQ13675.1 bifunctional adenosylcobinamide kinase/adenosylcobinamide-phosphate guanylyltransferase [Novosphingobium sp. PC22D]
MTRLLVLGGARSGKSRYAQQRAEAMRRERIFIATAQAFDAEMEERITRHRRDRGPDWRTIEAPLDLPESITAAARADAVLLVDCLTLWTTNLMMAERDVGAATARLAEALATAHGPVVVVANEVGWGIVPDNPLARAFRDHAGLVNQAAAQAVDEVRLVVAGKSLELC